MCFDKIDQTEGETVSLCCLNLRLLRRLEWGFVSFKKRLPGRGRETNGQRIVRRMASASPPLPKEAEKEEKPATLAEAAAAAQGKSRRCSRWAFLLSVLLHMVFGAAGSSCCGNN